MLTAPEAELPGTLRALCAEIGPEAAEALAEATGGRRIWVPATITSEHQLVRAIGLEAAQALAEARGGDWLEVPKADAFERARRNAAIRAAREAGATVNDLAGTHNLTRRQIQNITHAHEAEA